MVVRTRVFEFRWTTEHEKSALVLWLFLSIAPQERIVAPAVVPQCNIPRMPERSCTDPRRLTVHFPDTKSRALTSSTMAQKALPIAAGVVVAAVASALLNRWLAQKAERRNPPLGRFITVDGVRLHYVERGTGTPLVLLHGNGSMIEDFQSSGLIDLAAKKYRVIAIRPTRDLATATGPAAPSGRRKRRLTSLPPLSRKSACHAQSFSGILGERWWLSLSP